MALVLPVSVSVRNTAPAEVTPGVPHLAVRPFGNPEAMLMVDEPVLETKTAPPTDTAVTVTVAVERDGIESVCGDTVIRTPGVGHTCKVKFLLVLRPSPATVTTTVAKDSGAVAEAVSVSVSLLVLTLAGGVAGFADHFAVTSVGRPLTE